MSYNLIETSAGDSEPYELYKFTQGDTNWFFTGSERAITFLGDVYSPTPIKRSAIEQTQEINKSSLKVEMSIYNEYIEQFKSAPSQMINTLTIFRGHVGDSDTLSIWFGRHVNTKFSESRADLELESIFTSLRRPCLRFRYQRNCPHDLYGEGCGVNKEDFLSLEPISVISGVTLEFEDLAKPDNYYSGGIAKIEIAGIIYRRFIIQQIGNIVTLDLPFSNISLDMEVGLYAGCDRTTNTCNDKFDNILNFGGQPYYPEKNPFIGEDIF